MIKITTWTRKDVAYDLEWENSSPAGKSWSCLWEAPRTLDQHPCLGRNSKGFSPKGFGDLMSQGCDVKSSIGKSSCQEKIKTKYYLNFDSRSGMEHFVRSSYPGSSKKTLRSLKRQRAGRISELTGDKDIPAYVLPLRGKYYEQSFYKYIDLI